MDTKSFKRRKFLLAPLFTFLGVLFVLITLTSALELMMLWSNAEDGPTPDRSLLGTTVYAIGYPLGIVLECVVTFLLFYYARKWFRLRRPHEAVGLPTDQLS